MMIFRGVNLKNLLCFSRGNLFRGLSVDAAAAESGPASHEQKPPSTPDFITDLLNRHFPEKMRAQPQQRTFSGRAPTPSFRMSQLGMDMSGMDPISAELQNLRKETDDYFPIEKIPAEEVIPVRERLIEKFDKIVAEKDPHQGRTIPLGILCRMLRATLHVEPYMIDKAIEYYNLLTISAKRASDMRSGSVSTYTLKNILDQNVLSLAEKLLRDGRTAHEVIKLLTLHRKNFPIATGDGFQFVEPTPVTVRADGRSFISLNTNSLIVTAIFKCTPSDRRLLFECLASNDFFFPRSDMPRNLKTSMTHIVDDLYENGQKTEAIEMATKFGNKFRFFGYYSLLMKKLLTSGDRKELENFINGIVGGSYHARISIFRDLIFTDLFCALVSLGKYPQAKQILEVSLRWELNAPRVGRALWALSSNPSEKREFMRALIEDIGIPDLPTFNNVAAQITTEKGDEQFAEALLDIWDKDGIEASPENIETLKAILKKREKKTESATTQHENDTEGLVINTNY